MKSVIKYFKKMIFIIMSLYCAYSLVKDLDPTPHIHFSFCGRRFGLSDREQREVYRILNDVQFEEDFDDSKKPFTYNSSYFEITYMENGYLHKWFLNGRIISHIIYHDEESTTFTKFDDNGEMIESFYNKYM